MKCCITGSFDRALFVRQCNGTRRWPEKRCPCFPQLMPCPSPSPAPAQSQSSEIIRKATRELMEWEQRKADELRTKLVRAALGLARNPSSPPPLDLAFPAYFVDLE